MNFILSVLCSGYLDCPFLQGNCLLPIIHIKLKKVVLRIAKGKRIRECLELSWMDTVTEIMTVPLGKLQTQAMIIDLKNIYLTEKRKDTVNT